MVHTGLVLTAGVFSLLVCFLLTSKRPEHRMLIMISLAALSVFLYFSMMFRYLDAVSSRKGQFRTLSQIGFDGRGRRRIIRSEAVRLFLLIVLLVILYAGNVFCVLLVQGEPMPPYAVVLAAVLCVVPSGISALISYAYYRKTIMGGGI